MVEHFSLASAVTLATFWFDAPCGHERSNGLVAFADLRIEKLRRRPSSLLLRFGVLMLQCQPSRQLTILHLGYTLRQCTIWAHPSARQHVAGTARCDLLIAEDDNAPA